MPDQADNLRELIHAAPLPMRGFPPGPPMVLVAGGRAGVGTTTVAVNLAAALVDARNRVLLVDVAGAQSNLADIAGVKWSKVEYTISDVLAGRCSVAEAITTGSGGMMVLAARSRILRGGRGCESRRESPTWPHAEASRHTQQRLLGELQKRENEFDLTVVDLGCGLTAWTRRFWLQAQLVLMVTTTDSSALLDSYATIKRSVADGIGPNIRLVVNQCDDERVAADAHRRLSESCQRFLGHAVPAVPSLPRHVDDAGINALPRIWEAPNTSFGHAMLWLGRAIGDVIACGARIEASC